MEKKKLAVVLASENESEKTLYFKLKQMVEYICSHIMHINVDFSRNNENKLYHPINSCSVYGGDICLGEMGILHPVIVKNIDKRKNFAVLELDVEKMLESPKKDFKVQLTSKFQSISVDYNFVADKNMKYAEIEKA